MSFLNEKCAVKFKYSQLLPGSVKQSIHITKSETPLIIEHSDPGGSDH